ncbi:MAG: PQQ-dependent sugar dehydrogenase [Gemmatimonadota bacterium]|nr:PQQ-dependent sugar dehydrogenase [Gemmatimonadota bacterium]
MSRSGSSLFAAAVSLAIAMPMSAQETIRSAYHDYQIVTVVDGLVNPWSMAFLPGGDILVTERPGRLRVVRGGELLADPVAGVPEVVAMGQGGLLDVVPHPDFASNRLLYISYSKPKPDQERGTTAVIRARFENNALNDVEEVFEAVSDGNGHYGSRLAFDPDGFLFITVGDRQAPSRGDLEAHPAQDISNHHGTVNRIHDDGRVPADNPFVGDPNAQPEIYSYGHRNPQGLTIDPETGDVWITEHGPQGGDELNLVLSGVNFGWPVVGYGVNYRSGTAIHEGTMREGMQHPTHFWVPSIATSGLMMYSGDAFPEWRGDIFAGGMAGEQLARLTMDGQAVVAEETLVQGLGRIRDVRQGPDGFIYLAVDDRRGEPTAVVRLEPVTSR